MLKRILSIITLLTLCAGLCSCAAQGDIDNSVTDNSDVAVSDDSHDEDNGDIADVGNVFFDVSDGEEGDELVMYGDFEKGIIGWRGNYHGDFSANDLVSDPLGENGKSLHATGRWNCWSSLVYDINNRLVGGRTYKISVEVMFNDEFVYAGNVCQPADELYFQLQLGPNTDNPATYLKQNFTVKRGEWTTLEAVVTLPYDIADNAILNVMSEGGSSPENATDFYIDNVSVKEVGITDDARYALVGINILECFPEYQIQNGVKLPDSVDGYSITWTSSKEDVLGFEGTTSVYSGTEKDTVVRLTATADGQSINYYVESKRSEAAPSLVESEEFTTSPALGWNSFDGYICAVTEDEVLENAEFIASYGDLAQMAEDAGYLATLKDMGYEYIVIDQAWYMEPDPNNRYGSPTYSNFGRAAFHISENGYWVVDEQRFPSSVKDGYTQPVLTEWNSDSEAVIVEDNNGLKALADKIHSMGLKIGIHLQRGVPKIAVENKLPILGCDGLTCDMIADQSDTCAWNDLCYGIDMSKPGAQEYLNGEFERYAEWGIDYVKIDDLSRPYDEDMIEGYRKAIDNAGRAMYFSASPGSTPLEAYEHAEENINMWRIIDDLWDRWENGGLKHAIETAQLWADKISDYHYPDGDMVPFGQLAGDGRFSHYTDAEKRTLMSVWAMNKSPVMLGGRLRGYLGVNDDNSFSRNDETGYDDLQYVINEDIVKINQYATDVRLLESGDYPVWVSYSQDGSEMYLGFVNIGEQKHTFSLTLDTIKNYTDCYEVWANENATVDYGTNVVEITLPAHDSQIIVFTK